MWVTDGRAEAESICYPYHIIVHFKIKSGNGGGGGVFSHAPDTFCCDAKRRALVTESAVLES